MSSDRQYEAFYREHRSRVLRLLRRAGLDPQHAEDASQEVFLRVLQVWRALEPPVDWRAWLYRVSVRVAISYRRRAHFKRELYLDSLLERSVLSGPEPTASDAEAVLIEALGALPEAMSRLLQRHYLQQVPVKQLATEAARPLPTMYARIRSARETLARLARRRLLTRATGLDLPAGEYGAPRDKSS